MRQSSWTVLRHGHFRNVWIAAFGSSVGTWMEIIGVHWVMGQVTLSPEWAASGRPGAPVMLGYLAVAQMFPTLLLGLFGGVMADRVNRKQLLIWTQAMLMCVAAALAWASWQGRLTPGLMLTLGAINGVIMAFNIPAWQVLTPRLVPREELSSALVLNGMQFNMARVVGPALGGWMLGEFGATALFIVNTLSFFGVMIAVSTTPDAPAPARTDASPWAQTLEAVRYVLTNKGAFVLILTISLFSMLGTPLLRMLPVLVPEVYGRHEKEYGMLIAMMGAGAVLGGLTMRLIPPWYPRHHFVPLSLALGGASIVVFASMSSLWAAAAALVVVGVFWMWSFTSAFAALQLLVEDSIRGRVLSVCNVVSFGFMPLGSLIAGWISEHVAGRTNDGFGTQIGVGSLAVVMTIIGLIMLTWRTPEIDGLREGENGFRRRPGLIRGITARAHRPGSE